MIKKIKLLFLCTGNSCRSQMAEGWTHFLKRGSIEAYSAGLEAHGLNKKAVEVMKEAGVDISNQKSETVNALINIKFDYVVTVCSHADKNCPVFPGIVKKIHMGFEDPAKLVGDEDFILNGFRKVRDQIKDLVNRLPGILS